jgi:FAD-dependent urate hydroxylase
MRIAVIGAGIGGLAVARALSADGHEVACYERADALRTSGSALTLWSNGTAVLDALGVSCHDLGAPIDVLGTVRGRDGRTLSDVDVAHAEARYGFPNRLMPRRDLIRRLAESLLPDTLHFGRRAIAVEQGPETAEVRFAEGPAVTADLVIAADGSRSGLRDVVYGADPTRPAGWATWQGLTPVDIALTHGRRAVMIVGPEGMCGLMPAGNGLLQWWFDRPWDADAPRPPSVTAMLKERFGHWASPVPEVLAAADDDRIEFFAHRRQKVPKRWSRGRVVLLGDAAHTMPPTVAQGANQALEDAWALARGLRIHDELAAGLAEYERSRLKGARLTGWMAGTEFTEKYRPISTMLIPDALITRFHTRWLRSVSTILSV